MNSINITGRLGNDPELIEYTEGKHVTEMRVAIDNGQYDTTWIDVKVYNGGAKAAAEHLKKGSRVAVAGRLEIETWEKDDQTRSKPVIIGHAEFLDPKPTE